MLLVTGITGHSGEYFLQELIKNGYTGKIRCIVRESSDTGILDKSDLDIEKIVGDLNDQEFMDNALNGVDTVVHIASIFYSVGLMKAAIKNKVRRAILVHTTGIYSKYKSASEEYKCIENTISQLVLDGKSDIGVVYLRPTMIYGYTNDKNMIVFIKMVDKLRLFPVIDRGKSLLQPVNGRDLGKAYYKVLKNEEIMSGDYILSGDKPIEMVEMFKLISKIIDKKTIFINVPLGLGVFMAKSLYYLTFKKIDFVEKVQRMGEDRSFPHEEARVAFDYNTMSLEDGLKLEIEEYLDKK